MENHGLLTGRRKVRLGSFQQRRRNKNHVTFFVNEYYVGTMGKLDRRRQGRMESSGKISLHVLLSDLCKDYVPKRKYSSINLS